jgi:hypothetical protein
MRTWDQRLDRLQERLARPSERQSSDEAEEIRRQAEHVNDCADSESGAEAPVFDITEDGVFCAADGKPVVTLHQTLAEPLYWQEIEWGLGESDLFHDEERETFYTLEGEFALSRDRVNLPALMSEERTPSSRL